MKDYNKSNSRKCNLSKTIRQSCLEYVISHNYKF